MPSQWILLLLVAVLITEARILRLDNFNGAYSSYPSEILFPREESDMKAAVLKAVEENKRLRVVGSTTHSWGGLAMSDDFQLAVDTQYYNKVLMIDNEALTVRAQSGISIHDLLLALKAEGLTLKNCGAIDAQSLGGAMATATHGSNDAHGGSETLSDNIVELRLMDSSGEVHTLNRQHPHFNAARTSLGVLGIVLDITLSVRDYFYLYKTTGLISREELTVSRIKEDQLKANHSIEYFLLPQSKSFGCAGQLNEVVPFREVPEPDYHADAYAIRKVHQTSHDIAIQHPERIPSYSEELIHGHCAVNGDWLGESFDVLARQAVGQVTFDHHFLDTEYTVPLSNFQEALDFVVDTISEVKDVAMWVYVRFQPATDSLMAMNNGPDGQMMAYLDIGYGNHMADHPVRAIMEEKLVSLGARPHWGKINYLTNGQLLSIYPQENVQKFNEAKTTFDPSNIFGNDYTDTVFGFGQSVGGNKVVEEL